AHEGVLAPVAGDAHLGEAEHADAGGPGGAKGRDEARLIAVPIERRLVDDGGGDGDLLHTNSSSARARTPAMGATCSDDPASSRARGCVSVQAMALNSPVSLRRARASPGNTPCVAMAVSFT